MGAVKLFTWLTLFLRLRRRQRARTPAAGPRGKLGLVRNPLPAHALPLALAASAWTWGPALGQARAGETGAVVRGSIRVVHPSAAVHVYLITEEQLSKPGAGVAHAVLLPQAGMSSVWFRFAGISGGRYAIRAFQDVDGNGRLTRGLFGPTEPWCLSWQEEGHHLPPRFDDIAFRVDTDTNIHLALTR